MYVPMMEISPMIMTIIAMMISSLKKIDLVWHFVALILSFCYKIEISNHII